MGARPDWLLSVDPGLRRCGCALWHDGELHAAALVEPPKGAESLGDLVDAMSCAVTGWRLLRMPEENCDDDVDVIVEIPQTYGGRAARGDANDLISVAAVAGAVGGELVRPREWKGSVPKPKTRKEYLTKGYVVETRARQKLTSVEQEKVIVPNAWKTKMDVWDAVGIGLWKLGR